MFHYQRTLIGGEIVRSFLSLESRDVSRKFMLRYFIFCFSHSAFSKHYSRKRESLVICSHDLNNFTVIGLVEERTRQFSG